MSLQEDGAWYRRLVLREAADPSCPERGVMGALFDRWPGSSSRR
ncbi:hypothetical protein [Pseudonocardia sp.]